MVSERNLTEEAALCPGDAPTTDLFAIPSAAVRRQPKPASHSVLWDKTGMIDSNFSLPFRYLVSPYALDGAAPSAD